MRIVEKPWGREEIWAETSKYVGKYLYINRGHRLSLQYHEKKEETIRVISGTLTLETGNNPPQFLTLEPGEVYHVKPHTIHSFGASVHDDVVLVEVSTPELEDVVRLRDDYSR
jgi:mannose-6-phosphate isomerase-like protein (cupin superfamily)